MDVLNSTSLSEMLEKCSDSSSYHGMIVFNSGSTLKDFINEFVVLNRDSAIPGIRIIKQSYRSGIIEFTNDSTIRLVLATPSIRGRKCNAVLYDGVIDEEVRNLLYGCITPYQTVQWEDNNKWAGGFIRNWVSNDILFETDPMENITETEELDKFLKEFVVKS